MIWLYIILGIMIYFMIGFMFALEIGFVKPTENEKSDIMLSFWLWPILLIVLVPVAISDTVVWLVQKITAGRRDL